MIDLEKAFGPRTRRTSMQYTASHPASAFYDPRPTQSARNAAAVTLSMESDFDSDLQGTGLARGVLAGLALEAAMGLCVYAIWLGLHLIR
jgi:hypothetical protein